MAFLDEFEATERKSGKSSFLDEFDAQDKPQPSLTDRIYEGANALFRPDSVMDGLDGTPASAPNPGARQALHNIMSEQAAARALQPGAKIVDGLGGVVEVGARKGYAGIGRVEAGVIQVLADALGSDSMADIARGQQDYANQIEQGAVLRGSPVEGFAKESIIQDVPEAATNAIGSVIQTAPALAASVVAPELALPAIFATATAQEYGQGREAELNPAGAALRAPIQGAFEVIGEKLGGMDKLAKGLSAAARGHGATDLAAAMLASSLREIPSEEVTTTGQFLTDKLPGIGINQEAGLTEYGEAVKDTALATLLQSGAMAAGGKAISRVADAAASRASATEQTPPADVTDALGALEKAKSFAEAQRAQAPAAPAQPRIEISQGDAETGAADDAQAAENQARYEAEQANVSELPSPAPAPVDRGSTGTQLDNDAGSARAELLVQSPESAIPTAPAAGSVGDTPAPVAGVADGVLKPPATTIADASTQSAPRAVTPSERDGVRPHVEAMIRRRAAANEMGKSRVFDNAMTAAKQLMSGEEVKPAKFKNAANTLAGDKTIQQALMALHDIAKQPGPQAVVGGMESSQESSVDAVPDQDQFVPNSEEPDVQRDTDQTIARGEQDRFAEPPEADASVVEQADEIEPAALDQLESFPIDEVQAAESSQEHIQDFGEKIGGARKDTSAPIGRRTSAAALPEESAPAWRKRFIAMQNLVDADKTWRIYDNKAERFVSRETFATEEEADKTIPVIAVADKHHVHSGANGFEIWRRVTDRKRIKVVDKNFQTRDEAMRHLAENAEAIMGIKTSFGEEVIAKPEKVVRSGSERRQGSVNGQDFMDAFGFRGVEFGNWNNQEERQEVMNHAYDALLDMADILNVPPKALSLNGDLALAFGARGQGLSGARAHYERSYGVINLTKMKGAGALAHEWFHALDHYLGRQDGKASAERKVNASGNKVFDSKGKTDYASSGFRIANSGVREEVRLAFTQLMQGMYSKAEKYVEDTKKAEDWAGRMRDDVAQQLQAIRNDLAKQRETSYYKRNNKPASDEQLAELDSYIERILNGEFLNIEHRANEPKAGRRFGNYRQSNDALDRISEIFKAVRGRSGFSAERTGVMDQIASSLSRYNTRLKMLKDAQEGSEKSRKVITQYAMNAKSIDQGRATDYWTTETEMGARAFSAYIEDRVNDLGNKSDFLSYGSENWRYMLLGIKPFPEGEEREAINADFDSLFETFKTKETEQGIALFSRSAMKSVEANIQRGERAMNKALLDRADVNRAMYHNELGWIDFAWGDDSKGIQHIIRQRMNKDGLTSERIYQMLTTDLVETIAQGETIRRRELDGAARVVLSHNGHEAVLVKYKGNNGWLLTGWEVRASGAIKEANDSKKATHNAADSSDDKVGAGVLGELSALARGSVNDADIRMSRGDEGDSRGMRVEDVRAVLEPIEKAHPNLPSVIVVEKQADIPEIKTKIDQALDQYRAESTSDNLVKLSQLLQDDIEGAYVDGKIYIVASNIADEQRLREVYAHEGIGHFSIETMLNQVQPKLFDRLVARVNALEKDGNEYIRKLARTVDRRQPGLDDATRAKEIIALIAERGDHEADMTPEVRSLWQRIADAIKSFANLVFDVDLTDRDVRDIVAMAARHAQGEMTGSILAGGESVMYSDQTEPLMSRGEKGSKDNWLIRRDAAGRIQLAPTGKVYDVASAFIKKGAEAVNFAYAPPELRRMMRKMKGDVQNAIELAGDVAKGMKGMSDSDRRMVSDVIERMLKTGVTPPEHVLKVAVSMQQIMDVQTDDLVALGMLSGETAERWRGQYLPRFYVRDRDPALAELNPLIKAFRTAQPVRGLGGGSLKGRGLYEEIPVGDVAQWEALGWQVRDPLWKKNRQGKLELVDPDKALPDADKVMVWRDFTPEERERMGENRDSLFRFVMGYTSMQKDIALGRLFDSIARNHEYTRSRPSEGYTKVPDSVIPETGGVHRYGNLAGLYVRDDIMAHISQYEEGSELLQGYRKALSFWKAGKTVLNPVAHMNNVISNLTMAHFAGVSYWDAHKYVGALRDLYRGADGVKEAKDAGLFSGDLSREEFMNDMPDDIKAMLNQQESMLKKWGARLTYNIATIWLSKPMGKAYRAEDDFFKYLIYRDARQNGMDPADAVDYATQYIFNYDDLPKSARVVRDVAIPFFAYTYKAVPALAHTAANYPWRFAAPAALIGGVNALAYALIAGDDDDDLTEKLAKGQALEEQERKHLPPWMQGRSSLGTSKTVRLGTDERTGLPIYWDVSRFIPGGDLFDVTNQAEGLPLPAPIMPSNPVLTSVAALIWNKDTFTGKDITDKNDTPKEAAKKRSEWTLKMISPAIAPTGYHADRLMQAAADGLGEPIETPLKDYTGFGKDGLPVQPKFAAMQTVGIKARPVDLETSADIARGQDASEVRSIRGEIMQAKRLLNRGAISEREFERIRAEGKEKVARIRAEE